MRFVHDPDSGEIQQKTQTKLRQLVAYTNLERN